MKTLDEIKQMMSAGDTVKAEGALKELLVTEPNNLQAKMLYGTCRQLLGDEETFKRIHDELAPVMGNVREGEIPTENVLAWEKYHKTFLELTSDGFVIELDSEAPCELCGCFNYDDGKTMPMSLYRAVSMEEITQLTQQFRKMRRDKRRRKIFGYFWLTVAVLLLFWLARWLGQTI